jgi:hypothetical protein
MREAVPSFQASQAKMFIRPHLNRKKLGVVACACHPSYGEKYKSGDDCCPGWTGQKVKLYLQNK